MSRSKLASGFIWVLFGTIGQKVLQFIALMVLARLLTPEDFGVISAAMIIIGLINIFSELGIGPAIVQKIDLSKEDIGTGKVISASIGFFMCLVIFNTAYIFEGLMRVEGLSEVVKLLALILPISGLTVIGQSLLQRNFEFKKYMLCVFISYFFSQLMVAIPLALLGYGYYALVSATLAQNVILLISVTFFTKEYRGVCFRWNSAKNLANYGFGQSLGRLSNYFASQGDNFVIARFLGPTSLGFYGRAQQLMMLPTSLIGTVLDKVMFPALAEIQKKPERISYIYLTCTSIIAMISAPITVFLFVCADDVIILLLGDKWTESSGILKVLILVLFFRIAYKISDALARALGTVYRRAWRQMIYALALTSLSYVGSKYGLIGIAYGVSAAIILNYILMLNLSISTTNISLVKISFILLKNFLITFLLWLIVDFTSAIKIEILALKLFSMGFITIFSYVTLVFMFRKYYEKEIDIMVSYVK